MGKGVKSCCFFSPFSWLSFAPRLDFVALYEERDMTPYFRCAKAFDFLPYWFVVVIFRVCLYKQ